MNIAIVTIYNYTDIEGWHIENGFSFGRKLFHENSKDVFIDINMLLRHKEKYKSILEKYDKIYVSITSGLIYKHLYDIIDDRWVIGGPITLFLDYLTCELKGTFIHSSIYEYFNVDNFKRYENYEIYFNSLIKIIRGISSNELLAFNVNIGGGCMWNKCKFCSSKTILKDKIGGKNLGIMLDDVESQLECRDNIQFTLCDPSLNKSQLDEIINRQSRSDVFYDLFVIPSQYTNNILSNYKNIDCKRIKFMLGLETFSENGLKFLNKPFDHNDILECCEHISRLNGTIDLCIMKEHPFTVKEDVVKTKWFFDELYKRCDINNIMPFTESMKTYWLKDKWEWVSKNTKYPLKLISDGSGIEIKVNDIPIDSDTYRYNTEITNIIEENYNYMKSVQC